MKLITLLVLGFILSASGSGGPTLYDLKSKWRNVDDKPVQVSIAKGSYVVIGMVFTGCAHACPMTISKMEEIEKSLSKSGLKNIKLVLASFDVKNDRPKKLKAYQQSRKLDTSKWILLSPETDSDARELAVALGISYKDLGNGDFSHSNIITLLDKKGSPVAAIDNLNASPQSIVEAAKKIESM